MAIKLAYTRYLENYKGIKQTSSSQYLGNLILNDSYMYRQDTHTLYYFNAIVPLNYKQSKLLELLARNINQIISAGTLRTFIWGTEKVASSSLRTLVYGIRKCAPGLPLVSYSKVGYSLEAIEHN